MGPLSTPNTVGPGEYNVPKVARSLSAKCAVQTIVFAALGGVCLRKAPVLPHKLLHLQLCLTGQAAWCLSIKHWDRKMWRVWSWTGTAPPRAVGMPLLGKDWDEAATAWAAAACRPASSPASP